MAYLSISRAVCSCSKGLSCGHICLHIPYICYSLLLWLVSEIFPSHPRNYPLLVEKACLSVCVQVFSPITLWLSDYPYPSLVIILHHFHLLSNIVRYCFSVWSNSPVAVYCCGCSHQITVEMTCPCTICVPHFLP